MALWIKQWHHFHLCVKYCFNYWHWLLQWNTSLPLTCFISVVQPHIYCIHSRQINRLQSSRSEHTVEKKLSITLKTSASHSHLHSLWKTTFHIFIKDHQSASTVWYNAKLVLMLYFDSVAKYVQMNYTFAYYGGPGEQNMTALAKETKADNPTSLTHSTTLSELKHFWKRWISENKVLAIQQY